jgi:four helix bundle protein
MTIKCFEDLEVWQIAMELQKNLYKNIIPLLLEKKEFELINQMKGSCSSISSNIAEGFERNGNREFLHFLSIAKGSAREFKTQVYQSQLILGNSGEINRMLASLNILLNKLGALINCLKASEVKGSKFKR